MTLVSQKLGKQSEKEAARFLETKGWRILARNFRCALGEIDLVARENQTLVFVEVKSRRSLDFGPPSLAVDWHKQKKLMQLAQFFIKQRKLFQLPCRFDVISIYVPPSGSAQIQHIPNAFHL